MRRILPIILLSAATAALPARAATEASLKQILAESAKAPVTGFERTVKAEVRPEGDDGPVQLSRHSKQIFCDNCMACVPNCPSGHCFA